MNQSSDDQRFVSQITHLFLLAAEGLITEAQFRQLNQLLTSSPIARDYYYDFIASYVSIKSLEMFAETDRCRQDYLNEFLKDLAEAEIHSPAVDMPKPADPAEVLPVLRLDTVPQARRFNRVSILAVIAPLAAALLVVLFLHFAPDNKSVLVGRCVNMVNGAGETDFGMLAPGGGLYTGPVELTTGFAEMELNGGTSIVVQAPARLVLKSNNRVFLERGRLVVRVGTGQTDDPFVVYSAHASVVDYGTEFGVQVDDKGNTLTHVYEGKVELRSGANPLRFEHRLALVENQGGQADAGSQLIPKEGLGGQFVRHHEFETKVKASEGSSYHRWLAYSYQLRRDPGLAAYYTFERDGENRTVLRNMANVTSGMLDGALGTASGTAVAAWQPGRWPQKTALAFNRADQQYVEIAAHPAISINGPVTIAAWVECSNPGDGGHLLSNRVQMRSLCNYQIGYRGPAITGWAQGMHLARKANSQDADNQICSRAMPQATGWALIAATHDNDTVKFYLNGKLVDEKYWPHKQPLAEGGLMIGTDYSPDDPARFNGKIGEIVIAKRVFSEREILEMYEAGKP